MIRVELPPPLCALMHINGEVVVDVAEKATQRQVLDAIEARYPALRGTMRDQVTGKRRAYLRFYAGGQVYASADAGDNWTPIVRDLPAVLSVEVQTLT